jgi:hypothetical protein
MGIPYGFSGGGGAGLGHGGGLGGGPGGFGMLAICRSLTTEAPASSLRSPSNSNA